MRRSTLTFGILFGVSLLANAVLLLRGRESDRLPELKPPQRTLPTAPSPIAPVEAIRNPNLTSRSQEASTSSSPTPPTVVAAPVQPPTPWSSLDPAVARVVEEQERFRAFWKDLDRIANVQDRLDPDKYFQAVLDLTVGYLGLAEPARSRFVEATRGSLSDLDRARKEYDDARKVLPPRDKKAPDPFQDQRQAIDARLQSQNKAATDRLRAQLDPSDPRQREFSTKLGKWLRQVGPNSQEQ